MATPAAGPANQPTISFGSYSSAPGDLEGIGFGLRLLARILDYGVFYGIIIVVSLIVGAIIGIVSVAMKRHLPADLGSVTWHLYAAGFLAYFTYHWICEGLHGSTLGKLICGIVVISEDKTPCGMKAAAGRSLAYYLDSLFFGLVGYWSMQESPKEQRLGDKWNKTMVVKRSDVPPQTLRSVSRFILVFSFAAVLASGVQLAFMILKFIL